MNEKNIFSWNLNNPFYFYKKGDLDVLVGEEKCKNKLKREEKVAAHAFVSLTLFFVGKLTLPLKEAPSQYLTNTRFQL